MGGGVGLKFTPCAFLLEMLLLAGQDNGRTKMPGRIAVAVYVSCVYHHHRRFFFRYSLGILKDAPISRNH